MDTEARRDTDEDATIPATELGLRTTYDVPNSTPAGNERAGPANEVQATSNLEPNETAAADLPKSSARGAGRPTKEQSKVLADERATRLAERLIVNPPSHQMATRSKKTS